MAGHSYGRTEISGQANAHLGNDYSHKYDYSQRVQIEKATFLLADASALASQTLHHLASPGTSEPIDSRRTLAAHRRTALGLEKFSIRDVDWNNVRPSDPSCLARLLSRSVDVSCSKRELAVPSSSLNSNDKVPRKLTLVVGALCAALACRHVSSHAILTLLSQIQRDPMFPWLTLLVGYWISCCLRNPLSELSGDCVVFEDVFNICRDVPLTYFASVHILSGFFRTHYQGTSAEYLVETRQYTLLSGRYCYSDIYDLESICSGLPVSGRFLLMAARYKASKPRCLGCTNKLEKECAGGYRCTYCRRVYGVLPIGACTTTKLNTATFLQPPWSTTTMPFSSRFDGVQNLDLDIPHRSHPEQRAQHYACEIGSVLLAAYAKYERQKPSVTIQNTFPGTLKRHAINHEQKLQTTASSGAGRTAANSTQPSLLGAPQLCIDSHEIQVIDVTSSGMGMRAKETLPPIYILRNLDTIKFECHYDLKDVANGPYQRQRMYLHPERIDLDINFPDVSDHIQQHDDSRLKALLQTYVLPSKKLELRTAWRLAQYIQYIVNNAFNSEEEAMQKAISLTKYYGKTEGSPICTRANKDDISDNGAQKCTTEKSSVSNSQKQISSNDEGKQKSRALIQVHQDAAMSLTVFMCKVPGCVRTTATYVGLKEHQYLSHNIPLCMQPGERDKLDQVNSHDPSTGFYYFMTKMESERRSAFPRIVPPLPSPREETPPSLPVAAKSLQSEQLTPYLHRLLNSTDAPSRSITYVRADVHRRIMQESPGRSRTDARGPTHGWAR